MHSYRDKWAQKWEVKRQAKIKKMLNFYYHINLQHKDIVFRSRDMELRLVTKAEVYNNSNLSTPYFACKLCRRSGSTDICATADEEGVVTFLNIKNMTTELHRTIAHKDAVFDLAWVPNETKILTMSGDHTARLWDVGQSMTSSAIFTGHSKSIKCGDFVPTDSAIFATGSRDGDIHLWDSRVCTKSVNVFKPDQTIFMASSQFTRKKPLAVSSVTSLAFQDRNNLLCCGSIDEFIRIWDLRKTHRRGFVTQPKVILQTKKAGFTDLKLSPDRIRLYASCVNANIYCFNLHSPDPNPIAEFSGHDAHSFYVKTCVSTDGAYLISGSTDQSVYVWNTTLAQLETNPRLPMLRLAGHTSEVTAVDISLNQTLTLVSCADDGTIRTWKPVLGDGEQSEVFLDTRFADLNLNMPAANSFHAAADAQSYSNLILSDLVRERLNSTASNLSKQLGLPNYPLNNESVSRASTPPPNTDEKRPLSYQLTPPKALRTDESCETYGKRKMEEASPPATSSLNSKRVVLSPSKINTDYRSPTLNLPNYVLDGTGPSHCCARTRQKENGDWLTEIQLRSAGKQSTTTGKSGRRHRSQLEKRSSRKTLLEYYKKSSKGNDDCCQKS